GFRFCERGEMKTNKIKNFVPIGQLLLPDTQEIKKLKTLRGKEENYAYILGPLEFTIAACYIDNPKLTDNDIKKSLLQLKTDYEGAFSRSTMEGMLQLTISIALQHVPLTRHEFLLCIDCILDSIENRSWIPDNRAYLLWIANFFGLLGREEKKRLEKSYGVIGPEVGFDKNVLLKGGAVKGSLKLKKAGKNRWSFQVPPSWEYVNAMVYDALDSLDSPKEKERQEGAVILRDAVEICPDNPLALSQYGFFLCQTERAEEGRKLIENVINKGRNLFPEDFVPGKDLLEWGWLGNRPFLRCLVWLGMEHFHTGNHKKALEIFEEMLALNPDDNQGIRELAAKCLFEPKNSGNTGRKGGRTERGD
ncbi:MAG: tetratricopeptide repeat protein, partial [Candidatus Aenigmarchaeota archaeon]|nr:tetratricopeptide repeat protein [Candidatus Aenigmarchaeota archaeon]MDI6722329.1 tetratricopeptide repeat protein [Candidatus Aenigmarchaeota archaeon]